MGTPFCQENAVRDAQRKKNDIFLNLFFFLKNQLSLQRNRENDKNRGAVIIPPGCFCTDNCQFEGIKMYQVMGLCHNMLLMGGKVICLMTDSFSKQGTVRVQFLPPGFCIKGHLPERWLPYIAFWGRDLIFCHQPPSSAWQPGEHAPLFGARAGSKCIACGSLRRR